MRRLLLLLALLAVAACDRGGPDSLVDLRVDDLSHHPGALVGRWDLVSVTSSGYGGPPTTTSYRGLRQGYVFRGDGTAEVWDGTGATRVESYAVVSAGPAYPDAPPSLRVGDWSLYWGLDGDRLYVDHRPLDGGLYEYLRR